MSRAGGRPLTRHRAELVGGCAVGAATPLVTARTRGFFVEDQMGWDALEEEAYALAPPHRALAAWLLAGGRLATRRPSAKLFLRDFCFVMPDGLERARLSFVGVRLISTGGIGACFLSEELHPGPHTPDSRIRQVLAAMLAVAPKALRHEYLDP